MPYIKKSQRVFYDEEVTQLARTIKFHEKDGRAGTLNYVITTLLSKVYGKNMRYADHNELMGVLECVKQEWYRRRTGPMEDQKVIENGDVE